MTKHADLIDELDWCIRKLREVATDLREIRALTDIAHQANKLDEVILKLAGDDLEATPQDGPPPVHGGGTGNK